MWYYINAGASLATAWLLAFAITYDRKNIRRAWKVVLLLVTIEQAILSYGAIEALRSNVEIEYRQILFALVIVALMLSVIFVLLVLRRPETWWYYRDENLESPPEGPTGLGRR